MLGKLFGLGLISAFIHLSPTLPAYAWDYDYDEEVKNLPCYPDCSLEEELAISDFMSVWEDPYSDQIQVQQQQVDTRTFSATALYRKLSRSAKRIKNFPLQALKTQVHFFAKYPNYIKNKNFLVLIDFRQPSTVKRMHVFDTSSGKLSSFYTTHGEKSGTLHATQFSNVNGSHKSTLGFLVTGTTYYGQNGKSLNLHGLEAQNSRTYERRIVFHKASYASESYIQKHGMLGLSWGCPAFADAYHYLVDELRGGVLVYKFR